MKNNQCAACGCCVCKCGNNIIFPPLTFDTPGCYEFTIKEITPDDCEWITDRRVFRVVIKVEEVDGRLCACVCYPDGKPRFCNVKRCNPDCCCCRPKDC